MGGIEFGDVIGGDDAEQLAAFKPQADVEAVAAHRDCPVPVDCCDRLVGSGVVTFG